MTAVWFPRRNSGERGCVKKLRSQSPALTGIKLELLYSEDSDVHNITLARES